MNIKTIEDIAKAAYKKSKDADSQLAQNTNLIHRVWNDFNTVSVQKDFFGSGVSSGTGSGTNGSAKHPGIIRYISHASNADSGYLFVTDPNAFELGGGESCTFIFSTAALTGVTRRFGFHDTGTVSVPVDGAYLKQSGNTLTGETMASSVGSTTGTSYTLAENTWYRGVVSVNSNATSITFTLYADDSDTILWQDSLATNIPTSLLGVRDVCTLSTPSGATVLGLIDYIDFVLPNARKVR